MQIIQRVLMLSVLVSGSIVVHSQESMYKTDTPEVFLESLESASSGEAQNLDAQDEQNQPAPQSENKSEAADQSKPDAKTEASKAEVKKDPIFLADGTIANPGFFKYVGHAASAGDVGFFDENENGKIFFCKVIRTLDSQHKPITMSIKQKIEIHPERRPAMTLFETIKDGVRVQKYFEDDQLFVLKEPLREMKTAWTTIAGATAITVVLALGIQAYLFSSNKN
jgi:hypothetical protein